MKLGKEILASNAGRTLFLTAKDQHFNQRGLPYMRVILFVRSCNRSLPLLRQADEIHWALVGSLRHFEYQSQEQIR